MPHTVSLPAYLSRFKCIAADCEDTCCRGWSMQLDSGTRQRYADAGLEGSMVRENGATVMKRDPATGFCVKFEGGLCGIQLQHGESYLGDACNFYPRVTRNLGDTISMTATLSCPEIVRLALFGEDPFAEVSAHAERLPESIRDYLPAGIASAQATAIHRAFLNVALAEGDPPEQNLLRIFTASEQLAQIAPADWPAAVPACLQRSAGALPESAPRGTDSVYLLQALCGLMVAAKYTHRPRLMQTIQEMEAALHCAVRRDTLTIVSQPCSELAVRALHTRWRGEWQAQYAALLRRYLAMQVSLAILPFGGFGHTLPQRAAVMGIRLATVRLGLMSVCQAANGAPQQGDVVRIIQSVSGLLDHLADADFSLKIYAETGWLEGARLRGLLEAR